MRNILLIIDEIEKIVPSDINNYDDFKSALDIIKKHFFYTSPEALIDRWYELSMVCKIYISSYKGEKWESDVRNLFSGEKKRKEIELQILINLKLNNIN
jgi:hypothetical protein